MADKQTVLIVDDDPLIANLLSEILRISGEFDVEWTDCLQGLWSRLGDDDWDVILMDYMLPDGTGLEALNELTRRGVEVPVVMVTGQGDERLVVKAMKTGASDYLVKDSESITLLPAILKKVIDTRQLQLLVRRSTEQNRYQAMLLNNVRDAVVVWDTRGSITHFNRAAETLFGLPAGECLGRPVETVYLSRFNPPLALSEIQSGEPQETVRGFSSPAGAVAWISSRITALQDAQTGPAPLGYMDVCRDITDRKQAEESLRCERNFISAILNTLAAIVIVLDRDGRVVLYNRAFEAMIGRPLAETRGEFLWDLFEDSLYGRAVHRIFTRIQSGSQLNQYDKRLESNEGTNRVISWNSTQLLDERGQVRDYIITGFDITERKEMEAQIHAAHEKLALSTRMATIGELTSIFAHHINNPLTTIIADAQVLLQDLEDHPAGRESAEAIEKSGWRIQKALQQLFKFSCPAPETFELVSINDTVKNALELLKDPLLTARTNLSVELAGDLPPIRGQAYHLEDLWLNLLLLARDATYGDAVIHNIRVRTARADDGGVDIQIYDDGEIIPPEEMDCLFEPNFLKSLGRRGSGIELTICEEIVRQHNGEIRVGSDPITGTTFIIHFPAEV